jgi:hypothetical protein
MEKPNADRKATPQAADAALLDAAARMLHEELEFCHEWVRDLLAEGDPDTAAKMMAAASSLAGTLAKLKGETRQRITVERQGEGTRKSQNE